MERDDWTMWLLLIGGAVALYLLTRNSTTMGTGESIAPVAPQPVYPGGNIATAELYALYQQGLLPRPTPQAAPGGGAQPAQPVFYGNDPAIGRAQVN